MRRLPVTKRVADDFLDELVRDNRAWLLDLMGQEILSPTKQEWLSACGFTQQQFEDLWSRILDGSVFATLSGHGVLSGVS